jgi:hypothetical protein
MAVDLICPECGGIIGASDIEENGRGPCTCLEDEPAASPRVDKSDTAVMPSPPPEQAPRSKPSKPDAGAKICLACGKDVTGHRRTKDSRGYMCLACAKAEIAAKKEGTIPCAQCRRRVKPAGLVLHRGEQICKLCFQAHKDAEKKIIKSVPDQHYREHEKQKLVILGAIFFILLLIVIWRSFF